MADSGYLTPPPFSDSNKEKIWSETKKRLDRFLPNLFDELFPVPDPPEDALPTASNKPEEEVSEKPASHGNESSEKAPLEEQPQPSSPNSADVD